MALLLPLLLLLLAGPSNSDFAQDREQCANTLVGLATCLAYVQGSAGSPTPDCCMGLKGVLAKSPKCLCVLIKDRNNPSLGVQINLNRALTLPDTCKATANISHCPELLNLPPNSPDAQIFKNLTATTSTAQGSSTSGKGSGNSSAHESSNATPKYNYYYYFLGEKKLVNSFIALFLPIILIL